MSFMISAGMIRLADRIFAEIAQVFHRELPSATICPCDRQSQPWPSAIRAAYPAALFAPGEAQSLAARKLRVFIAHGLDGRARFLELAKHIRTDHSIYGLQAKGVDGLDEPSERIDEMAAFYLEAIGELQPVGPYIPLATRSAA